MGLISGVVSLFGWDLPQLEWFHWRSVETRSCLRPFVVRVFIGAPNFWRFTVKWVWQRNSSYQTSSNLFCEDPTQPFRKPCWKRSERRHPQGGSCLPCLMNAAAAKENLIGKPLPETEIASPQLVILPLQLWSEDRHRHRQATNMYINIYIYTVIICIYIDMTWNIVKPASVSQPFLRWWVSYPCDEVPTCQLPACQRDGELR